MELSVKRDQRPSAKAAYSVAAFFVNQPQDDSRFYDQDICIMCAEAGKNHYFYGADPRHRDSASYSSRDSDVYEHCMDHHYKQRSIFSVFYDALTGKEVPSLLLSGDESLGPTQSIHSFSAHDWVVRRSEINGRPPGSVCNDVSFRSSCRSLQAYGDENI